MGARAFWWAHRHWWWYRHARSFGKPIRWSIDYARTRSKENR